MIEGVITAKNIKFIIAYDGRDYLGWQKTFTGQSVEMLLQSVLEQILQHPVVLQAASRTDRGVHARGQVINFYTSKAPLDLHRLRLSTNQLLPHDIVVLSAEIASSTFHPTLDSKGKEYRYYVCYDEFQMPEFHFHSWHTPGELDLGSMRAAALLLVGKHNFAAFCNFRSKMNYTDYKRYITSIVIDEIPLKRLCVTIRGDHFLYKMVRNLVGTLIYIGRGKIKLEGLEQILKSQDRTQAGITAPAHGLFLEKVFY